MAEQKVSFGLQWIRTGSAGWLPGLMFVLGRAERHTVILFLLCLWSQPAQSAQPKLIACNDERLQYMGRIDRLGDDAAVLYWPGSSVSMSFTGSSVKALMMDEEGNNYFDIIVDGNKITRFKPDATKQSYLLAQDLPPGKHTIQLFRLTESKFGKTLFYGFEQGTEDSVLPAPPMPRRKMEFYGASIMSGLSIEAVGADSQLPLYENNYASYTAITARHYDAAYQCISKSGIGFMVSWCPITMPELYDRLNPNDAASKWDFSKYIPDVVVIYVGQNDADIIASPQTDAFKAKYTAAPREREIVTAYKAWVQQIRNKYPRATIICELENTQGSEWAGYIERAVAGMGDSKILAHLLQPRHTTNHPRIKDHKDIANQLITFIDQHVVW